MNGVCGTAVKQIMQAIENGTLPTDETQRRLIALIEEEANRTDGPADENLISACVDLLERLQGRTNVAEEARIAALNERIAAAIARKENHRRMGAMALRLVAAAAVILLFVGVRFSWFEHSDTPDGQQHVITGQEITVEMVQAAIAENVGKGSVETADLNELQDIIGFDPHIPKTIADEWHVSMCRVWFMRHNIQVTVEYRSKQVSDESIKYVVNYFTDVNDSYLTFEQSDNGKDTMLGHQVVYISMNLDNYVACWIEDNIVYEINCGTSEEKFIDVLQTIIGGDS